MIPETNPLKFKVYSKHQTNLYFMAPKADIESAFKDYLKLNPDSGFGGYEVSYSYGSTVSYSFKRIHNKIVEGDQYTIFNQSNSNDSFILNRDKIENFLTTDSRGKQLSFSKDSLKEAMKDYVRDNGMPSEYLKISDVDQSGKPVFEKTSAKTDSDVVGKFAIQTNQGSTYAGKPIPNDLIKSSEDTTQELKAIDYIAYNDNGKEIRFSKDSLKEAMSDYVRKNGMPTHNLKIISVDDGGKPKLTADKEELEAGKRFVIKPPNASLLNGQTITNNQITINDSTIQSLKNIDKAKKEADERVKEEEKAKREEEKRDRRNRAMFNKLELSVGELESITQSIAKKQLAMKTKIEAEEKAKGEDEERDRRNRAMFEKLELSLGELELGAGELESITLIYSFFNPSGEATQETLGENTADRIKELLTKVLTEDTQTSEGEEGFNKILKAYFIEMVKAEMMKTSTSEEASKMVKLKEIFNEDEKIKGSIEAIEVEFKKHLPITQCKDEENVTDLDKLSAETKLEEFKRYLIKMTIHTEGENINFDEIITDELIEREIQKAKKEELLLSRVRLHIKEYYPQLPITIDLASPSQQDKKAFRELLESENESIETDYTCERINKFKIYKSNKTSDFFVIFENQDGDIFVFDKKDIFDTALTSHIDMKDKEIEENLRLITSYFESPNDESLKTQVSDLLKKEFEIIRFNPSFKSIYGEKFKEQAELEGYTYKTETLALYDDCKFDLIHKYFNAREDDSPLLTAKLVFQLLKNGHHEYLKKFQELLKKEEKDSDAYKKASLLLKKSREEASIDNFFKGKFNSQSLIIKEISADPELMEYFTKKLDACSKKIDVLTYSYKNSSTTEKDKEIILKEIAALSSIKNPAQKILEKIAKTTRLVGDVIDSISPSGSQATEDSDESAEEESNVRVIKVFLSQLKSAIEIEKGKGKGVSEEQAVENIKIAFFASFPPDNPDNSDPSKDFKIKFFNSLVDTLNNKTFTQNNPTLVSNPITSPEPIILFNLFSETFNEKTMTSLETFKDSVETIDDIKSAKTFFETKKGESAEIWDESQKLAYSAIFSSLFLTSKKYIDQTASAPANPSASALTAQQKQTTH